MRSQYMQSAQHQGDWDRNRNEADSQRAGGTGSESGRPYPRSAPEGYPESHYQYQAQRDHPGIEYFGGGGGYGGGRGEYGQHAGQSQGAYGPRSEPEGHGQSGYRQQEAFQAGGHQYGSGGEDFGRGGYGGYGREQEGHFGQSRERHDYERQFQGQGSHQTGQPQHYGTQERGQFLDPGGYRQSPSSAAGYASYGSYQVGSQPQGGQARARQGPKGYVRSDERIREVICESLTQHPFLDVSEVSVQVSGGRVVLEGFVPLRNMKHEIEDVADSCWGVTDVENRIRVQSGLQSAGSSSESSSSRTTDISDMSAIETGTGASMAGKGGSTAPSRELSGVEPKVEGKKQENR